jgi:O-antigen/teichoic acid export membrane protein
MERTRGQTTIIKAMVWFGASYAGALAGYVALNAVTGRWLGPGDFGWFVTAMALGALLGQVGLVGVHRSGLREAARLTDRHDPRAMGVLRNGVRAVLLTTLPAVGIAAGIGVWFYASDRPTGSRAALAVGVAALVVLCGQQKIWANYLRGLGYVRFASLLEGRSGGALVAGIQAIVALALWELWPASGLAGAIAAVAVGFALPGLFARRLLNDHWRGLEGPPARLLPDLRLAVGRDWRFLSSQVAVQINLSAEIFIAAALLSNTDTSMYSAGQRLALLLVVPLTSIQVVFSPVIARLAVQPDKQDTLQSLLRTGATVATAMTIVVALPILVAPGFVLDKVYGPGFEGAVPVVLLLSIGFIVNVVTGMAGSTLSMLGREGVTASTQWTGAVLRVVLGVLAAYWAGLAGLTCSALVVSVLIFISMWLRTRKTVGFFTHATIRPELGLLRRTTG